MQSLWLQFFRSYPNKSFQFSPGITLIVGENARGKTNILEAIALLATGESFRAQKIEEMITWGQDLGRVKCFVQMPQESENPPTELEVVLTTGKVQGQRAAKRRLLVDGAARRKKDFFAHVSCVTFRPEDMELVDGSPSLRRRYLDGVLCQASQEYRESLDSYEKALKRRNKLLVVLREGETTRQAFFYWDQLLIKHGNILSGKRREYVQFLESFSPLPMHFSAQYDASEISEARLRQYAVPEVSAGHTLVGPHKDDLILELLDTSNTSKNLEAFGSRGEQRMAVLWLKMAELTYLKKHADQQPILLLDDVFSELDKAHQEMVLELAYQQQTIITSTPVTLPAGLTANAERLEV